MTEAATAKGVLLDTSILIELLRSNAKVQAGVSSLLESGYVVATSVVCVAELYAGMRKSEEAATGQLVAALDCLPITLSIAQTAGNIKSSRARTGRTHGVVDMMIAATALEFGYPVVTENRRDFEIPGLELLDLKAD